jgi:hypothetical protein
MSAKCLNLVRLYRQNIPPASLEPLGEALATFGGFTITDDVSLVCGDVGDIIFKLCLIPGITESSFQFFSFSAFEGRAGRIEHLTRKLAREHLRHEFGRCGLEIPASLQGDDQ